MGFGTYTEYFLFLGPALAGGALLTIGRGYVVHVRRSITILAFAVLISPMIWYRGIKSLLVSDYAGDVFPSPYMTENPILALGRALGTTTTMDTTVPVRTTLGLALLVVGGILLGLVLSRYRVVLLGVVATSVLAVAYATLSGRGYLQNRLVTLTLPLFWLAATVGWALLARHLRRNRSTVGRLVSGILIVSLFMATSYYVVVNGVTAGKSYRPELAKDRNVSGEYDEVLGWVRDLGGPEGRDVTVAVPELFPQLWSLYELRNEKDVSYLCLRPDFLQPEQYWNGEVDRYIIVGRGVAVAGAETAIVAKTEHFRLIDMSRGSVAVVIPANMPTWSGSIGADGSIAGSATSRLVILRGSNAPPRVNVVLASPLHNLQLALTTGDGIAASTAVGPEKRAVGIAVGPTGTADLTLTTNDTRDTTLQFQLLGASFPPNQ